MAVLVLSWTTGTVATLTTRQAAVALRCIAYVRDHGAADAFE